MLRHGWRIFTLSAVTVVAAHAQSSIAVAPVIGYYRPLGQFAPAGILSTDLPNSPDQLSGIAWGGSLRVFVQPRVALEATALTSESTRPSCLCPGGPTPTTANRVTIVSTMVQYAVVPRTSGTPVWVSAGPAIIHHGGTGYGRYGAPTDWGGMVGLDVERAVTAHLRIVAGVKGVAYTFDLDFPPEHGRQLDAIINARLEWHRNL